MRICMYTAEAFPRLGGAMVVIDSLARQYLAFGHEVVVLATPRRATSDHRPLPYPVIRHPRFYTQRWLVHWYGRWLAAALRKYRFDVVHCHSVHPTGYVAARCPAMANVPLVITSHGDVCSRRFTWQKELPDRCRLALQRADATVAVSEFIEGRLRELCSTARRIERMPNGVELARYTQAAPRPANLDESVRPGEYVLFLGRLVAQKGGDLLLDAFARAAKSNDMGLVVAGEGQSGEKWAAQAARLGLANRVRFVGRVEGDRKTYLYQNALCTVVPSRTAEAFGLVVLESYASGRPVIATEIPGLRELVVPERTGLLVPPDSSEALAGALSDAMADRTRLDEMGREGRRLADNYDWERIARWHLDLYGELSGRNRREISR